MPKLPTVKQMNFRSYPPLKGGPPILWPTKRYFRRNEDPGYATHSSVTVDRIVMVVLPNTGNGNLGLPNGAPAVDDNELQTIDFAYSGSISELYRNGTDYFEGIIANVKYYLSGELIHSWSINSNSNTETDFIGGLVLTIVNGNAGDWGLFDRQANGDWLGQELNTGYNLGYFNVDSTSVGYDGFAGRTTDWIGVLGMGAIMLSSSDNNRSRWQYSKDNKSTAVYGGNYGDGNVLGSVELILPALSTDFRIYINSDYANDSSISIKEVLKNV